MSLISKILNSLSGGAVTPHLGQVRYDTLSDQEFVYDGNKWCVIARYVDPPYVWIEEDEICIRTDSAWWQENLDEINEWFRSGNATLVYLDIKQANIKFKDKADATFFRLKWQ